MNFGQQKIMAGIFTSLSQYKKQNQSDILRRIQIINNRGEFEKTSVKNEEASIKIEENQEKLIEEDKNLKIIPLHTFTKFNMIAQQDLENGLTLRQIYEEQQALKKKQQIQKFRYLFIAQFKAIQEDHPEMIAQSIEYLFHISKQYELSQHAKKTLTRESITIHFSQLLKKGGRQFYLHSIALIETHLLKIIQEFNASRQFEQSQFKIQIELLCCFLKIAWDFQDYIPQKMRPNQWNINLARIAKLFKISFPQLQILKNLFLENQHKIAFFTSNEFQLNLLWTTYYLLLLKNKYEKIPPSSVLKFSLEEMVHYFKANKLKEGKQKISETNIQKNVSLTSLYHIEKFSKRKIIFSTEKSLLIIKEFEEFISKGELYQQNYPLYDELAQKYQGNRTEIRKRFVRYVQKRKSLLLKFNNDLSSYKNALITRQLIQKPECCYEEAAKNIFSHTSVYVEQQYFKDSLFSLLLKEVQYQQFKYLGRVFRGISERIHHGKSVLFLDSFSLREERGHQSEQQEKMAPNASIAIAVTLKGALLCRTPRMPFSCIELLKQYRPIFQGSLPSIILLFDDQFPFSLELDQREEVYLLRKTHTVLLLPRTSLEPNPCRVIADYLKSSLKQRLNGEGFEKAFQGAIHCLGEKQVKNIVDKEWEKVQTLAATRNPALRDEQIKEQANSKKVKEEDQKLIEEFEGLDRRRFEPKELSPFKNIYLPVPEMVKQQENSENQIERPSQQFLEELQSQKVRVNNQATSLPQSIMQNLQYKSIDTLQTALTHLLSRNKKDPFNYNEHYPIRIHQRLPLQQFIHQFNKIN